MSLNSNEAVFGALVVDWKKRTIDWHGMDGDTDASEVLDIVEKNEHRPDTYATAIIFWKRDNLLACHDAEGFSAEVFATCIVCDELIENDGESTYCGSIHPDCAEAHAAECGVCRKDFFERGLIDSDGPDDDDLTTEDHIHWFQRGKPVLTTADPNDPRSPADDWQAQLGEYMHRTRFFPNIWFISDHGNAHRIDLSKE